MCQLKNDPVITYYQIVSQLFQGVIVGPGKSDQGFAGVSSKNPSLDII
jgi:hypothetical protein